MFYAPCASRRRGHIILSAARPQFAQRPLSVFTKCWKLHFSPQKSQEIFFGVITIYINLQVQSELSAQILSTSSRRMTASSQEGILALSVLTRNVWKTFQSKERKEEIVCPFLCISMILLQPHLYLYHIRTQDGAVYFVHSFVPEVISRLPE